MENTKQQFKNLILVTHYKLHVLCFGERQTGQALITLLFFMIISITIISVSVVVTLVNTQSTSIQEMSNNTYSLAESGAEDGIVKLLRDPNYIGETYTLNQADMTIEVSGVSPKIIVSKAVLNGFIRKVEATIDYTNNILRVLSWKEIL